MDGVKVQGGPVGGSVYVNESTRTRAVPTAKPCGMCAVTPLTSLSAWRSSPSWGVAHLLHCVSFRTVGLAALAGHLIWTGCRHCIHLSIHRGPVAILCTARSGFDVWTLWGTPSRTYWIGCDAFAAIVIVLCQSCRAVLGLRPHRFRYRSGRKLWTSYRHTQIKMTSRGKIIHTFQHWRGMQGQNFFAPHGLGGHFGGLVRGEGVDTLRR